MALGIDLTGFTIRAASVIEQSISEMGEQHTADAHAFRLVHYAEAAKPRRGHFGFYESFLRDVVAAHEAKTGAVLERVGLAWDDHHSSHGELSTVQAICEAFSITVLGVEQATTAAMRSGWCELDPTVTQHWPRETFEESRASIGVALAATSPAEADDAPDAENDTTTPDDHPAAPTAPPIAAAAAPLTAAAGLTAIAADDAPMDERLAAALARVDQLEMVAAALRASADEGLREASRREARIVELSDRLDTLQVAHDAELRQAHRRGASMAAEVTTLRSSFQAQKEQTLHAASGMDDLQSKHHQQETALQERTDEVRQLQAQLEEHQGQQENAIAVREETIAALEVERTDKDRAIAERDDQISSLKEQITALQAAVAEAERAGPSEEQLAEQNQRVTEAFDAGAALGERAARRVVELEEELRKLSAS